MVCSLGPEISGQSVPSWSPSALSQEMEDFGQHCLLFWAASPLWHRRAGTGQGGGVLERLLLTAPGLGGWEEAQVAALLLGGGKPGLPWPTSCQLSTAPG